MIKFGKAMPHDIHIQATSNQSFIVNVGCCTAAFTDVDDMLQAIGHYIKNPEAVEKLYNEKCAPTNHCVAAISAAQLVSTQEARCPDPGIDSGCDGRG